RPVIIDSDVVFPAPFGPTRPAKEPAAISRLIPATASFAPKLLRSPRTMIAGSAIFCLLGVRALYPLPGLPPATPGGPLFKTDITMLDVRYQLRQAGAQARPATARLHARSATAQPSNVRRPALVIMGTLDADFAGPGPRGDAIVAAHPGRYAAT